MMNTLQRWWQHHPNLISFAVLAAGMLTILYFAARHVGFSPAQWLVLAIATTALAAFCVWIIGWETGVDADPLDSAAPDTENQP